MIEAISAIQSILSEISALAGAATAPAAAADGATGAAGASNSSFPEVFAAALGQLDGGIASAHQAAKSFASGADDIPLSDVMVSLEQANLSLQLAATVRDKIVAAYTNVMNMPV